MGGYNCVCFGDEKCEFAEGGKNEAGIEWTIVSNPQRVIETQTQVLRSDQPNKPTRTYPIYDTKTLKLPAQHPPPL